MGDTTAAVVQNEYAIAIAEELRDYESLRRAHSNIGTALTQDCQNDRAMPHLYMALDLAVARDQTPTAIGAAYTNLGSAHLARNEIDKAAEFFDMAIAQAIYGNDREGRATAYANYGNMLQTQHKYDEAIRTYTEILECTTNQSMTATALYNRGYTFYTRAEAAKAAEAELSDICDPEGDPTFTITFGGPNTRHKPRPSPLTRSMQTDYINGRNDFIHAVGFDENTFQNIKGSIAGLSLSVSLLESNAHTFKRLQDCLCNIGEWSKALMFAEQSRARSLGELLLKRHRKLIQKELDVPLSTCNIARILEDSGSVVVYSSDTGDNLLVAMGLRAKARKYGLQQISSSPQI